MKITTQLWIWNWTAGGYNSCQATDREDALKQANAMTRGNVLVVNESTLHVGTDQELRKLDAQYRGMFD